MRRSTGVNKLTARLQLAPQHEKDYETCGNGEWTVTRQPKFLDRLVTKFSKAWGSTCVQELRYNEIHSLLLKHCYWITLIIIFLFK